MDLGVHIRVNYFMNKKINILFVTTTDQIAGAEKTILDTLRLVDREKFNPQLIVFKHAKNGELIERARELGIPVTCLNIQSKWQFFKLVKLFGIIKDFQPDILESFLFFDNVVCRIIGTIMRVPVIISGQQNAYLKRSHIRNIADRMTIGFADGVISNSQAGKDWYVNQHYCSGEKIMVIKSGIDTNHLSTLQKNNPNVTNPRVIFNIEIPDGYMTAVSIGFLEEQKGIVYLIDAVKILKEKNIPIYFFIIGDGALRNSLERKSQESDVSDRIHFVGFKSAAAQYLHSFDMFILPSLWEGLPNVVIEAMASNVPVIATNVGGVSEMIEHEKQGLIVSPRNSAELADAISRLVKNSELRTFFSENARSYVNDNLTAEGMVSKRQHYYEQLFEKHKKQISRDCK